MTLRDFDVLKPGDFVYHPGFPDKIWTVIGRPTWDQYSFVAILGRYQIKENHLWQKLLEASDEKRQELARRFDMTVTRMVTPGNWNKEHPAGTYSCLLCGTTTAVPHICPVFAGSHKNDKD